MQKTFATKAAICFGKIVCKQFCQNKMQCFLQTFRIFVANRSEKNKRNCGMFALFLHNLWGFSKIDTHTLGGGHGVLDGSGRTELAPTHAPREEPDLGHVPHVRARAARAGSSRFGPVGTDTCRGRAATPARLCRRPRSSLDRAPRHNHR